MPSQKSPVSTRRRPVLATLLVALIALTGALFLTVFWASWRAGASSVGALASQTPARAETPTGAGTSAAAPNPTLAYGACLNEWQPRGTAPDVSQRAREALITAGVPDRMDVLGVIVGLASGEGEDCLHPETLLFDHFWPYLVTLPVYIAVDAPTLDDDGALGDISAAAIFALRDAGIPNPDSALVFTFGVGEDADRVTRTVRFRRGDGEALVEAGLRGADLWGMLNRR